MTTVHACHSLGVISYPDASSFAPYPFINENHSATLNLLRFAKHFCDNSLKREGLQGSVLDKSCI